MSVPPITAFLRDKSWISCLGRGVVRFWELLHMTWSSAIWYPDRKNRKNYPYVPDITKKITSTKKIAGKANFNFTQGIVGKNARWFVVFVLSMHDSQHFTAPETKAGDSQTRTHLVPHGYYADFRFYGCFWFVCGWVATCFILRKYQSLAGTVRHPRKSSWQVQPINSHGVCWGIWAREGLAA